MSDNATKYIEYRDVRAAVVEGMVGAFKAPFEAIGIDPPASQDEVAEVVSDLVSSMEVMEKVANIYREAFTQDELAELLAFSESPLGQKHTSLLDAVLIAQQKAIKDNVVPAVLDTLDQKFGSEEHFGKEAAHSKVNDLIAQLGKKLVGESAHRQW